MIVRQLAGVWPSVKRLYRFRSNPVQVCIGFVFRPGCLSRRLRLRHPNHRVTHDLAKTMADVDRRAALTRRKIGDTADGRI